MKFIFLSALLLATIMMKAQDWPELYRYKDANEKLGSPKPDEKRVVFMGNSITEGWLSFNPSFFTKNGFINRGISGQTTPQMLLRFRQDVIALKPKAVVILAGINDIAGNTGSSTLEMIQDNLASMAQLAKANNIKVVMCSVLPAYDFSWRPGLEPAEKVVALNKWIQDYTFKNGYEFVDYHSLMKDTKNGLRSELGEDGVHPNARGYQIMEAALMPVLQRALLKD